MSGQEEADQTVGNDLRVRWRGPVNKWSVVRADGVIMRAGLETKNTALETLADSRLKTGANEWRRDALQNMKNATAMRWKRSWRRDIPRRRSPATSEFAAPQSKLAKEHPEFLAALNRAKAKRLLEWEKIGLKVAREGGTGGQSTMITFGLKNMGGVGGSNKQQLEHTGRDGGPSRPSSYLR